MALLSFLPALAASAAGSFPAAFDLRRVNGKNYLSPVRNHHLPVGSACASCWAVTSASVMGDRLNLMLDQAGVATTRIEVAAQHLLNCVPGQHHCGYPGSASAAMRYVAAHGIPDESCAPWQNAKLPCDALHTCAQMMLDPSTHKPAVWPNGTHKLAPVENPRLFYVEKDTPIPPNNTEAIMQALQSGPVPCGIHAEGLIGYTKGVVTDPDRGLTSDDHSVAIVGWGVESGTPYWTVQVSLVRSSSWAARFAASPACHACLVLGPA
eukprot:SAG22_NODE_573_length_8999_cov_9.592921_4_plen_266_part_00